MKLPKLANATLAAIRSDRRGATIVEFALVAPILIMAIIGGMDLG